MILVREFASLVCVSACASVLLFGCDGRFVESDVVCDGARPRSVLDLTPGWNAACLYVCMCVCVCV